MYIETMNEAPNNSRDRRPEAKRMNAYIYIENTDLCECGVPVYRHVQKTPQACGRGFKAAALTSERGLPVLADCGVSAEQVLTNMEPGDANRRINVEAVHVWPRRGV